MGKPEIDKIGRVKLSDVKPLIEAARSREDGKPLQIEFTLQEIAYSVIASAAWSYLLFVYTDRNGEKQKRKIMLQETESNLGRGSVLYFLCPYTGHKCRKLFCDGRVIASRYAFNHVYSYQKESRKGRTISQYTKIADSPERKRGKTTYKGKVTRYGKKLLRYYEMVEKRAEQLEELLVVKPMGRPRKKAPQRVV